MEKPYRKEKRNQRKQQREEKKKAQGDVVKRDTKSSEDDFFDADSNQEDNDTQHSPKSRGKQKETGQRPLTNLENGANTGLLIENDLSDEVGEEIKHFDMKGIIKAEKLKGGKKRQRDRKKNSKQGEKDDEMQEEFRIDVQDDRFKALHEDHAFAIDPSNPQ